MQPDRRSSSSFSRNGAESYHGQEDMGWRLRIVEILTVIKPDKLNASRVKQVTCEQPHSARGLRGVIVHGADMGVKTKRGLSLVD